MKTIWICERCGEDGVIEHDPTADVLEVIYMIQDDHDAKELGCGFDVNRVRIRLSIKVVNEGG